MTASVDRDLAEQLAILLAGRHLLIRDLLGEAEVARLSPRLGQDLPPEERWGLLAELLNWLRRHHRAESCWLREGRGGTTLYTVALIDETPEVLRERHYEHLRMVHPATYVAYCISAHLQDRLPVGPIGLPLSRALTHLNQVVRLALRDGLLGTKWYPDGVPDLSHAPATEAEREHLSAYATEVEALTLHFFALLEEAPTLLQAEVEARRLPCSPVLHPLRRVGPPFLLEAQLRVGDLARARRRRGPDRARPPLWIRMGTGSMDADVYALLLASGPNAGVVHDEVGHARVPISELGRLRLTDIPVSPHRCCPELGGRVLLTGERLVSLHRHLGAMPAIPRVGAREDSPAEAGPPMVQLHAVGCLVLHSDPELPDDDPLGWHGLVLWAEPSGVARGWEAVWQATLTELIAEGRMYEPEGGTVGAVDRGLAVGYSPAPAAPLQRGLQVAMPFTVSLRLRGF